MPLVPRRTTSRAASLSTTELADEPVPPPVDTTLDWLTMTRAVLIETASGTVTSDSWAGDSWAGDSWAGDSRAGGTGTSKGTLGAGVGGAGVAEGAGAAETGAWVGGAALVTAGDAGAGVIAGDGGGSIDLGASAAVAAGAANTPPSRAVGVVAWPQPATTAINTERPSAPSPEASLPRVPRCPPSRWLAAAARGRPPARGTHRPRGAGRQERGCCRSRRP